MAEQDQKQSGAPEEEVQETTQADVTEAPPAEDAATGDTAAADDLPRDQGGG